MRQEKGFTLLELMIVIAILGIVLAIAVPSINDYMDKRRAINAAESIYSQLVYARSEAISRSKKVAVVIKPSAWALGITEDVTCDPSVTAVSTANACVLNIKNTDGTTTPVLKRIDGNDYAGVTIDSETGTAVKTITFDPVRGTVVTGQNGTIHVLYTSLRGTTYEYQVIVGPIGRTRICVKTDSTASVVGGYAKCN